MNVLQHLAGTRIQFFKVDVATADILRLRAVLPLTVGAPELECFNAPLTALPGCTL
jgi:hypothetical protein